jgi:2-oxoglutarate dehydrogenase E1 component
MELLQKTSLLNAGSSSYLEQIYDDYLRDPSSIPPKWAQYFEQLPKVNSDGSESRHLEIQEQLKKQAREPAVYASPLRSSSLSISSTLPASAQEIGELQNALLHEHKQIRVRELIDAYRLLGHLHADIDPLKMREKAVVPELMLSYYHLSSADLETPFDAGSLPGPKERPLRQILQDLQHIYCDTIASEFMHIPDSPERIWVQEQVEAIFSQETLPLATRQRILKYLTAAEGLEKYLGAKYPGAKRFSLEGTDTLIVALDTIIQEAGVVGAKEIIICMPHRGRLNILVNLLGKLTSQLFDEFEGKHHDEKLESGDVKYHQGFSSDVKTLNGPVHLSLAYNPSHLEIVAPVVCGSVRARQERRGDLEQEQVLPIAIHGDAAFAGQGVVMENMNMSQTRGYKIGGTLHIIVNNQIGFTTSNPKDARSTLYCSDLGKMLEVPILHVNANDPEAVYRVALLALSYRTKFKKDIIIDLIGYRRQGHNEADEPSVTQPLMYQIIRKLPTTWKLYSDSLVQAKIISSTEVEDLAKQYREALDNRQSPVAGQIVSGVPREFASDWQPYLNKDWRIATKTSVPLEDLKQLAEKQLAIPSEIVIHPRVQKIMDDRRLMTEGKIPMDWGYAETLAYATLLSEGYGVRLSGQDVGRGTFFHRQAVIHNQKDGEEYVPLRHLSENQATFTIVDSLLSEEAVLAFEYGFSNTEPKCLVIWEAQFGDFANNAQGVTDQFISSGEQKWGRHCGLTLFLPHGYEGQGPEHSSARLERYLQLCAEHNMQVCVPSTPAQIFHLLRRQILRPLRKPLIVITPKSLLRHKLAVSTLNQLSEGSFLTIIPEIDDLPMAGIKRVILCSGKVYYELLEKRRADNKQDIAIIRIEQLYPFPDIELQNVLKQYNKATEIVWCQEEPQNQGAWFSTQHHFLECLQPGQQLRYAGRAPSAAAAVGYHHLHQEQQNALIQDALS